MLHAHLSALALAAVAVAASGCGGSSSKTGATAAAGSSQTSAAQTSSAPKVGSTTVKVATGTPLTRAALIAKANAICARTGIEIKAISVGNMTEFRRELPQAAIYYNAETTALLKLVPPASMAHDWATFIKSAQLFSEYARLAGYNGQTGHNVISAVRGAGQARRPLLAIARRDGIKKCAQIG
jgi:hypothetical protein